MKRRGDTASISLSSPAGGSSVQVYHDCQKVPFQIQPGDGSHTRDHLTSPDISPQNQEEQFNMREETLHRTSALMMDSSSQGPEDNSTDPHESLTGSSTVTFVDVSTVEENHSLQGRVYLKELVLIDDEEDGDMSLREKTVTDLSVMEGKAADLVCGRLLSTSSGSMSDSKDDRSAREAPPAEGPDTAQVKSCCFCTLL